MTILLYTLGLTEQLLYSGGRLLVIAIRTLNLLSPLPSCVNTATRYRKFSHVELTVLQW